MFVFIKPSKNENAFCLVNSLLGDETPSSYNQEGLIIPWEVMDVLPRCVLDFPGSRI